MNLKFTVALLVIAMVSACGKDDSGLNKNKNVTAAPTSASSDQSTIHQGDIPETDADADQKPAPKPKKHKKAHPKPVVAEAPAEEPLVAAPAPTASPAVIVAATPVATPVPDDAVVGLGSVSQKPSELLDRGYPAAILDARFCSVSGKFTNGSRCYVVYKNGRTQMADAGTHAAVEAFIVTLQAKADAEKTAKAARKAEKKAAKAEKQAQKDAEKKDDNSGETKKGKFHWIKKLIP